VDSILGLARLDRAEGRDEEGAARFAELAGLAAEAGQAGVEVVATAGAALLCGGDPAAAAALLAKRQAGLTVAERMEAHLYLGLAGAGAAHTREAGRLLETVLAANPASRDTLISGVPLHREAQRGSEAVGGRRCPASTWRDGVVRASQSLLRCSLRCARDLRCVWLRYPGSSKGLHSGR
jgi:hypothetical protein